MAPPGGGEDSGADRARTYHRALKLALTITDLVGCEMIAPQHLAEALQYRPRMAYNLLAIAVDRLL